MAQAFATVAVPFAAARAGAVDEAIAAMGNPAAEDCRRTLDADARVHFMSLSVVPDTGPERAHLVLELTADGGVADALAAVARALNAPLARVIAAAGLGVATDPAALAAWLGRHNLTLGQGWAAAFGLGGQAVGLPFCGTPAMSVTRIRQERALAERIGAMDEILFGPATPLEKLNTVRARIRADDAQRWAFVAEPAPLLDPAPADRESGMLRFLPLLPGAVQTLFWPFLVVPLMLWLVFGWLAALMLPGAGWVAVLAWIVIGFVVALAITAALGAAAAALALRYLHRLEAADPVDDDTPNAARVGAIMARESVHTQNLLASVSTMKPGLFRRMTLRAAFWLIAHENPRVNRPGFLGTMGVIHFARWVLLPGTDRLCFWSNHTGSWESYVEIFIQREGEGVTSIWSNTRGFPRTRNLFGLGARDGDRLRRWARRQQYPAGFWYAAYPDLRLERIRRNAAIRQGIAAAVTDADAADWLACFGAQPRPAGTLEAEEIPTLVFGGRGHLAHCACLAVRLADDPAQARAWLRGIAPEITYGHEGGFRSAARLDRALAVAFTAGGLRKLGLADEDLATFAPAFQNGMTSPGRARALGDPETYEGWLWGHPGAPVDAFLVLYAAEPAALDARLAAHREAARAAGQAVVHELRAQPLSGAGGVKEPFRFLDGISNPVPAGTPRARDPALRQQVLGAGEFVLGYPDNGGYLPPTPRVASARDPDHLLPDPQGDPGRQRPRFVAAAAPVQRDFGRNGSYFVVRQIEQDVAAFDDYVQRQAGALRASGRLWDEAAEADRAGMLAELIAAKLVGRWRSGASLVRHPAAPAGTERDNDFLFGRDDAEGLRCPFGAHIRRANPRDAFDTDDPEGQAAIVNRHRILRVGRPYLPAAPGERPGAIFMCLNADIERQFEFVQQTWLLGRSFAGLENERDPVLAANGAGTVFTIPTHQGPLRLAGLAAFTRVRGGGYFFMPSRRAIRFLCQ